MAVCPKCKEDIKLLTNVTSGSNAYYLEVENKFARYEQGLWWC